MNDLTRLVFAVFFAIVFVTTFSSTPAIAEVFTWVDENGRKHFGDRIPPEYQNQTNPVDLDVYRPSATDVEDAARTDASIRQMNNALSTRPPAEQAADQSDPRQEAPGGFGRASGVSKEAYAKMSDQQQQQAYAQSQSCFNACADVSPGSSTPSYAYAPSGVMYDNSSPGKPVRNMANCGHCTDLPPPRSTRPR